MFKINKKKINSKISDTFNIISKKRFNKIKKSYEISEKEKNDIINNIYKKNYNREYFNKSNNRYYVKKSSRRFKRDNHDCKLIAFYLPQFHTIPENDMWWGKGFTEWTNVTRAVPQIDGQYQPHLPDELGFYDLNNDEVFSKQIELAKKYGIYGFAFHYYWFSGKRLLEKPLFNYLNNKNLDFPFMLCWPNEPWTKNWDGAEKEVLMPQIFEKKDYLQFIKDAMPFFKDDRYIKINNSPVFIVYRPKYFEKSVLKEAISIWRNYVKTQGFNDLYLINAEAFDYGSNEKYENFDAAVQFTSYKMAKNYKRDNSIIKINPDFNGFAYDYEEYVKSKTYLEDENYTLYRTALVSWDNTPRAMENAFIFNKSSPELFKEWLIDLMEFTKYNHTKDENFVFIHSWNEWAEGAYLEPDTKYGFAYLEATLDAMNNMKKKRK